MNAVAMRRVLSAALLLGVVWLVLGGRSLLERVAEQIGNPVSTSSPYAIGAPAQTLHERLFVADMHADTLLAARDLTQAAGYGQLDLPRLRAGHVRIQVFSIVTNMPFCLGLDHCGRNPNLVALLAAVQGWPIKTWSYYNARALHQAAKLRSIAADPAAGLVLLENADDLARLLTGPPDTREIAAVLAVEGAQAVGNDVAGVDELADAGVRMLGLAHFFDNAIAGSAHGLEHRGITAFGEGVVKRALARGMLIDVAHASPAAIDDFLARWPDVPFVVSHTGLRSICDNQRNLTDAQVRHIVRADGLVGIGAWNVPLCLPRSASAAAYVDGMVKSIMHALALAEAERPGHGQDYIALGSDFDGWVPVGFDASGWPLLTQGLLEAGLTETQIASVMGGNFCRLLLRGLPRGNQPPSPDLCNAR
jgi:membrane dipeptidase